MLHNQYPEKDSADLRIARQQSSMDTKMTNSIPGWLELLIKYFNHL